MVVSRLLRKAENFTCEVEIVKLYYLLKNVIKRAFGELNNILGRV